MWWTAVQGMVVVVVIVMVSGQWQRPSQPDVPFARATDYDVGDEWCRDAFQDPTVQVVYPQVRTTQGVVVGRFVYLCDGPGRLRRERIRGFPQTQIYRNVSVFLGIPYARPPTRENGLRFRDPQAPPAQNVIQADKYKPSCLQPVEYTGTNKGIPDMSEDCLYLNIFSPYVATELYKKYPVMIYIHGDNWDHGSAETFPGHMLAASQEVVVVTFNYRLGPLGFLATADEASPGNYGMLDQVMAIDWVYTYISQFNGDNSLITLFGPGAGGASAGIHAFSPRSGSLVKRVIASSGSPVADWAVITDPSFMVNTSILFGNKLGCTGSSSWRIVECLRSRGNELATQIKPQVGWLPWGPVIDKRTRPERMQFLPEDPKTILQEKRGYLRPDFDYMTGVTRSDGVSILLADQILRKSKFTVTKPAFQQKIREYIYMYNYTLNPDAVFNAISFMYTNWADPENTTLLREGYIDMLSDSYYTAPNDEMVKLLLENDIKPYVYVLNYTIQAFQWPDWYGVPHDTEYFLITGAPFMDPKFYPLERRTFRDRWTDADRNMSQLLMEAWGNFAKVGNPTPVLLFNAISWKPAEKGNLQYISLNTTNVTQPMFRDYRQREAQFWNYYLPSIVDKIQPTWPPTFEPWELERRVYSAALWGSLAAAGLFLVLTVVCCCLYCRAKSRHAVDADQIPRPLSSLASSEVSLEPKKQDFRLKYEAEPRASSKKAVHKQSQV